MRIGKLGEVMMLDGLMQAWPLLISGMLRHAQKAHADREIVSRLIDEPLWRYDWAGCGKRSARLANALVRMGVGPGDRITTLAWNTHRHVELMYAVPGMGAVLHTANPRLADEHILYTLQDAASRILFFDRNLLPMVERLKPELRSVEHFVMLCDETRLGKDQNDVLSYEQLLHSEEADFTWPRLEECAGAILCHTSGTTGSPKGVLYSHRSITLHALAAGLSGSMSLTAFDAIMPASSLYHANGWGLPFAAAINGCKLVLPADKLDGASLHELITAEGVTMSAGVPTVWTMYLEYLRSAGSVAGNLERIIIGGSALPEATASTFAGYGIITVHALGMTEANPLIVVSTPTPSLLAAKGDDAEHILRTRQGRAIFGVELRIVDANGGELPWDGASAGNLHIRGAWVLDRYYPDVAATDSEGWFDTGDIATIDQFGFLRITDRKKDVIKSGGEWISSIDLENHALGCPGVRSAAVIGVYHPLWEERPLMIIETEDGATVTAQTMRTFLEPYVARWWLPDDVVVAPVPLTATGKIDKKVLRQRYQHHLSAVE